MEQPTILPKPVEEKLIRVRDRIKELKRSMAVLLNMDIQFLRVKMK
jgi:hypothetical protein